MNFSLSEADSELKNKDKKDVASVDTYEPLGIICNVDYVEPAFPPNSMHFSGILPPPVTPKVEH